MDKHDPSCPYGELPDFSDISCLNLGLFENRVWMGVEHNLSSNIFMTSKLGDQFTFSGTKPKHQSSG